MADAKLCAVDGCGNSATGRGWCNTHYQRWRRLGDPLLGSARKTRAGEAVGWLRAHIGHDGDECLIWPFSRYPNGYAKAADRGKVGTAHRMMCKWVNGPPPTTKHESAHSCGNGHLGCVHPKHLRWATSQENKADTILHGTIARGERNGCSTLTAEDVRNIRLRRQDDARDLAAEFGVGVGQIQKIFRRDAWAWLSG